MAAATGTAFALLFGAGNALWALDTPRLGRVPVADASTTAILTFYRETSTGIVVGALLSLVSIALFVVFASAVRRILIDATGEEVLATSAFGGALLAMATGLGAETLNMVGALRAGGGELDAALGRALFDISQVLGYNAAGVGLGLFLVATAVPALRTGRVLPRPVALTAAVVGVSLLTPLSRVTLALSVPLILVIALVLARTPTPARPRTLE